MIYLSDDYFDKYVYVFGYLFSRSIFENYTFDSIQKTIAYSKIADELESSNITTIAFSSSESIYRMLFPEHDNEGYSYNPYDQFGWLGYLYVHLFLKFNLTFELLFIILPIEKALNMYRLYHEMDIEQSYKYFESLVHYSYLDNIMDYRKISTEELSRISGLSFNTLKMIRYNKRDISKTESQNLYRLSRVLNVKMTTLITNLELKVH